MLKLFPLFIIFFLCFNNIGCKDDSPIECPNIDNIGSEVKINGEKLLLHKADIYKDPIPGLDTYEFIIEAVGSDCNQLLRFRFIASLPNNEPLEGEFNLFDSAVYTANRLTSFIYTIQTLEPLDFHSLFAIGGKATITSHAENEYSIRIEAPLTEDEELDFNLRFQL